MKLPPRQVQSLLVVLVGPPTYHVCIYVYIYTYMSLSLYIYAIYMYVVLFHTLSEVVSIIANVNLYVVYAYICTIQVDATTSPPNYQGRISKLRGYVHKVSNTNYLFFSILGGRGEKPHQTSLGMKTKRSSFVKAGTVLCCVWCG